MEDTNSLIEQRKAKLAALRSKGIDPFKNKFTPTEACAQARANYVEGREVALAGRITAYREMGKSIFFDIKDQSGRIQVYAQKNALGDDAFSNFKLLDLADFIGINGHLFTTKTGEISVKLSSFVILAKALRPPPAKWHGLVDTEIRYRQRYLDLISSDEVKEVFMKRSRIVSEIRNFLIERGFVEVETPMMQPIPGGAAAQPFVTHHNSLGCNFYLRIALELYLKRLLVGGVDRVFEIGRNFRNEGLSRKHNPEFTMLEAYQAYGDYETMMELVQSMVCQVAQKVLGTLKITRNRRTEVEALMDQFERGFFGAFACSKIGIPDDEADPLIRPARQSLYEKIDACSEELHKNAYWNTARAAIDILNEVESVSNKLVEDHPQKIDNSDLKTFVSDLRSKFECFREPEVIDLTPNWRRVKYKDLIREKAGADWFEITPEERKERAIKLGAEIGPGYEDFEVTNGVYEKLIEPGLIQPTFVTHLPKELVPLAKLSPDDPTTVEVFECAINGQEISPAYSEQNDPIEQRERLEHQAGGEQQKLDEDFLVSLEHGMPPAGGMGMGIDRLCMMLLGQESIRDVILFPQLKPKS